MNKKIAFFSFFLFLFSFGLTPGEAKEKDENSILVTEGFSFALPNGFAETAKDNLENETAKTITYTFKSTKNPDLMEIKISQMTTPISTQGNLLERINAFQSEEVTRKFVILFQESQKFEISPLEKVEWKKTKILEKSDQLILILENEILAPRSCKSTGFHKYYIISHPTGVYTLHFLTKESNEDISQQINKVVESFATAPIPPLDPEEKWSPIKTIKDVQLSIPEAYNKGKIEIAEDNSYKGEFQGFSSKEVPVSYPYLITLNRIYPKESLGENATTFKMIESLKSPAVSVTLNKYFQKTFTDSLPGNVPQYWEDSDVEMIGENYVLVMKGYFKIATDEFPIYHEHYIWTHPTGVYRLTFHFINQKDSKSDDFINKTLENFSIKLPSK